MEAMIENVVAIWRKTAASRGTQLIFCDLGVHPTAWGYSVYEEIIEKLVSRGNPTRGNRRCRRRRYRCQEAGPLRAGAKRLGPRAHRLDPEDGNRDERPANGLSRLHHLDAPWKPAEVEQREGRIFDRATRTHEVAIYRYVTEGSFDAFMWQALETKAEVRLAAHDRRVGSSPGRRHRRPGALIRRGQSHCLRQSGSLDARLRLTPNCSA